MAVCLVPAAKVTTFPCALNHCSPSPSLSLCLSSSLHSTFLSFFYIVDFKSPFPPSLTLLWSCFLIPSCATVKHPPAAPSFSLKLLARPPPCLRFPRLSRPCYPLFLSLSLSPPSPIPGACCLWDCTPSRARKPTWKASYISAPDFGNKTPSNNSPDQTTYTSRPANLATSLPAGQLRPDPPAPDIESNAILQRHSLISLGWPSSSTTSNLRLLVF